MVTFENKSTNLNKISEALEDNLNIIPSNSSLSTIVNKISDSRYTFKLIDETETLPISSGRASLLYKNWLYVGGGEGLGNALVIIDTNTMQIIKQITLAMGINIVNTFNMVRDDTYWYIGTSESYVIRGNLETGDAILSKYNTSFRSVYCMCVDENYLYIGNQNSKFYKLTKDTLEIVTSTSWFYSTPISLICDGDFLIGGGSGAAAQNNSQSLVKINKADMSLVLTSNPTGGQVRECMIINGFLYVTTTDGRLTKWDKDTLTFISTIYTHTTIIRTLRYAFGDFWLGDDLGRTLRVSPTGQLLGMIQSENSSNYVLEIDENNQMLYRNSSVDVTVTKYQIIDNLQNNTSTTVIKTADLVSLNTAGTWADTVYTLNGMNMTCVTLNNGYLRQLSFTGTTTADSEFVIHDFNANKKLTASTDYILNGVKSTDSLSTVFVRLILSENADGSGDTTTIEKETGDFNVTTTTNLYYKISIIIKSGVTLSASLYNNIPTLYPK